MPPHSETSAPAEPLLEKPSPPAPHECCGGGSCCPCVWDRYYDQLALWRAQQPSQAAPSGVD